MLFLLNDFAVRDNRMNPLLINNNVRSDREVSMTKETVIDNEFCSMWYYPDKKIVHHKIHKFIFGETFQKFILSGTELIKKHHATKWLSDDRDSPVLRKEDMDWGEIHWFPQTIAAGWKYWAIVMPQKALGQMNMQALAEVYGKKGIIVEFFLTPDEGMKWLENQAN
jgi:hypothetical protein